MTHEEIRNQRQLSDIDQIEAMRRRLRAMERWPAGKQQGRWLRYAGQIESGKGRVVGHPEGYGFVTPIQGGDQDIYLSSRQMRRVFDGDIVRSELLAGTGVAVLRASECSRAQDPAAGRALFCESGIHFVRPDNRESARIF